MIDAMVMVSASRRKALTDANQPVPPPVAIRALIDTGASNTCIDPSVLRTLNLTPTGSTPMITPTTGAEPQEKALYDVMVLIPAGNAQPFIQATLPVCECDLFEAQGFHALIGRDILSHCLLVYNGLANYFSLAY